MAAGGGLVKGGVSYSYKKGPDGNLYAVGGEVSIDTSGGKTPQETIQKMQRVQAAALAPADPSPQDRSVAAEAAAKSVEAVMENLEKTQEQIKDPNGKGGTQEISLKTGTQDFMIKTDAQDAGIKTDKEDSKIKSDTQDYTNKTDTQDLRTKAEKAYHATAYKKSTGKVISAIS